MRIRTKTFTRVGAVLLASAMLATGCADSDSDSDSKADSTDDGTTSSSPGTLSAEELYKEGVYGEQASGEPVKGGILTVGEYAEPRSLDPTVTYPFGAVGASAMAAVYDVLVRYDYENREWVPQLAESVESNDDYTEWTLKLKPDTKFSNGTPLNAEAVVASQGYYVQGYGFNFGMLMANVASSTVVDDLTVTYELNKPWPGFIGQFASGYGMIMAPAAYKGGREGFKPIGAGPFKFKSYKPAEELILERNDAYSGGEVHLDGIRFAFPNSDEARLEALKAGDFDQISIRNADPVEDARNSGIGGAMMPSGMGMMFWINAREGRPGADVRIRKAIAMAMDPETWLERVQGGAGIPSRNIYAPDAVYYAEVDELESNIEEAKKLVAEAKADGTPTKFKYITQSDQTSKTAAVTVEAILKGIGLDVEVEYLASITDQVARLYATFDYDMATSSMSIPTEDPFVTLANALLPTSSTNAAGYNNPEMTALIEKMGTVTGDELTEVAKQVNELWQEDIPGVAISPGAFYMAWGDNVNGIVPSANQFLLYGNAWKS